VDILAVDSYARLELCTPLFFCEAQHKQELLCGKYLALVGMCMSLGNLPKFIQL
jgi:hypothetical protein